MIRTGDRYRGSLREGREIHIDGEWVADVVTRVGDKKHTSEAAE